MSSGPRGGAQQLGPGACGRDMSEGGAPASGKPGSFSCDDVDSQMSGAENVDGWGKLVSANLD